MKFYESKIQKCQQETSDSYSFICALPEGYQWKAGQHARWRFVGFEDLEGEEAERIFTISSAPEDGVLMFTTRIADPHSPLKDALLKRLQPDLPIQISDPLGKFTFHEGVKSSLCIAGGIGITPVRSLLRHFSENPLEDHPITLFYSDDRGEYAYGNFWDEMKQKMPNLEIQFFDDGKACGEATRTYARDHGNDAEYLIAGSPGMNKFYEGLLAEEGIEKDAIVTDKFMGY